MQTIRKRRLPQACSFTLIELLVVVAIIAILASLLLPALTKAREKARQTSCANTIRNLGMIMVFYGDDNESYIPPWFWSSAVGGNNWVWAQWLWPTYIANEATYYQIYHCDSNTTGIVDYGLNGTSFYSQFRKSDSVNNPVERMLIADGSVVRDYWTVYASLIPGGADKGSINPLHPGNNVNCVFLDGHIEGVPANNIPLHPTFTTGESAFWGKWNDNDF